MTDEALRVREFWFGPLTAKSRPGIRAARGPLTNPARAAELERRMELWFGGHATRERRVQQDADIREQFSKLVERAANGALAGWADSPRRRLSLIILLDQFPRNMFRGQARAFAYDQQALGLALSGMQSAADGALEALERMFFYMPLQHSEQLEVQDESVTAYRRLLTEAPEDLRDVCRNALDSAQEHLDIIRRFGRFPSRNRILGRVSTPEERAYLQGGGESFGQ
jgi:uncharacterized protein (DUF924 family)